MLDDIHAHLGLVDRRLRARPSRETATKYCPVPYLALLDKTEPWSRFEEALDGAPEREVTFGIRPEDIHVCVGNPPLAAPEQNHIPARIQSISNSGFHSDIAAEAAGLDMLLVGDSLGMCVYGYSGTIPVTMDQMIYHTRIVNSAVKRALVVADMPFLSYQPSIETAVTNAGRFLKEGNARAVKM